MRLPLRKLSLLRFAFDVAVVVVLWLVWLLWLDTLTVSASSSSWLIEVTTSAVLYVLPIALVVRARLRLMSA